jgi:transposase InsO family protein
LPILCGERHGSGELLKLGIDIGQTSVAKYMAKRRDPPSQGWRTFLRNHADGIAAMDLFVVPTISFRLLYGLLIVGHGRRRILWFGATAHPTAEWIANQITEACGWEQAPRYLIRDRDGAYGEVFIRRLRSMGIRDRPTSPRSPWQNGYAERLIGSIRRECLDRRCVQRAPPPSPTAVVHEILQRGPHIDFAPAVVCGQLSGGLFFIGAQLWQVPVLIGDLDDANGIDIFSRDRRGGYP